jgi:CubicO group peptidase (beta-lactamase class C family)
MRMIVVLVLSLMPSLACRAEAVPPTCGPPADMSDGWAVAAPLNEGLDPHLICTIGPTLKTTQGADLDGVVVVRHGTLVYEHYFADDDGMEYSADSMHDVRSVTKSVVALLVGIALDRGWLKHVDDRVSSYFPDDPGLRSQDKGSITLRDLLTMTMGLDWPELAVSYDDPSNIERRMNLAPDPYRFVLAQPLATTPGTVWNYNSGGVELLGAILMKVSHQPLDKFAQQALFEPLGIRHWAWLQSSNGKLGASWGLRLRPRDLAKIGQLVLNHGTWNGHQIVSAQWISDMVTSQVRLPWQGRSVPYRAHDYGYLWWLGDLETRGRSVGWVAGVGWGGQRLYVVPSLDLVVAVTASNYKFGAQQYVAGYTVLDIVLRAALEH